MAQFVLTLCQLRRKEKTQPEIAKELGISRSYVSRIEKRRLGLLTLRSPAQIRFAPKQKRTFKRFT
ncbi:MAG TPA: sigma factor-like helix-turn-helix DNA-binding protein [Chondromyces sp.]|nr:sigma factor-like helix-turn-helix DNA-binding protein [Chondromyces sp.]